MLPHPRSARPPRHPLRPEDGPELGDLIEAANHVATTARNLLTSMLAAGLTIATTMLASSDEALLRDSIEVMDAIGIKTRLSLIFLLVPVFFVFVHLNALMKLFLLHRRLGAVEEEMVRRKIPDGEKIRWRRLVHGFGFAQIHLPPENGRAARDVLHHHLQRFLMWVAIVLARRRPRLGKTVRQFPPEHRFARGLAVRNGPG